ncbi:hypothetical protein [Chakrabartyella piscis]|uniref:hypothetical protein n=1 Tax=Chakrabartyella piscis TaxID=2918914 RepID=UPI002958483D|nr:hypothetical protein [Chakrabartyella piscis]
MKTCSFFGHREVSDTIEDKLLEYIEYAINTLGITAFYVGGYGDFDRKVTNLMIPIRNKYPHIQLLLALAYLPTKKDPIDKSNWYDDTVYFDGLEFAPKRFAITKRNRLMVESSDAIICYITRNHGGAYTAVKYAKKQEKPILNCVKTDVL